MVAPHAISFVYPPAMLVMSHTEIKIGHVPHRNKKMVECHTEIKIGRVSCLHKKKNLGSTITVDPKPVSDNRFDVVNQVEHTRLELVTS